MIGIVFHSNIRYCPYLERYKQLLEQEKASYEIIYWDRQSLNETSDNEEGYVVYKRKSKLKKNRILKLFDFYLFSRFLKRTIKEREYKKLIILTTINGILLSRLLKNKYKNKYIYDIRDYSYEHFSFYKRIEKKVILNSSMTFISSPGFKEFLPKSDKYLIAHNFNPKYIDKNQENEYHDGLLKPPIKLLFLGSIRHLEFDKSFVSLFKENDSFLLEYAGSGPDKEKLEKFILKNKINNTFLSGYYINANKRNIIANSNLLINCYPVNKHNRYAISNKYYDSIIYKKPQIVSKGSISEKLINEKGLGIAIDIDNKETPEIIQNWYKKINFKQFYKNCNKELERIIEEDEIFVKSVTNFILEGKNNG